MRRTVAHRENGKKIEARIGRRHPVEPARHVLRRDHMWRRDGRGLRMVADVPDEPRPIASRGEVREPRPDDARPRPRRKYVLRLSGLAI